ncbi:MAG: glycosyltransferase family 2 protein [Bacteroidales bacterium]|jgi:glycosyltransferase involved in cell wall biosynthesis|nr:glycosyltransferase family 2 protein [Bacteroidales bacterium]
MVLHKNTDGLLPVCVVIPTYNHAPFLEEVLNRCFSQSLPIIVINDGCTDQTLSVIDQILQNKPEEIPFVLVNFSKNRGKGSAIKAGAHKALELGFHGMITIDSDSQHNPEEIPLFLEQALRTPDAIIIGSRGLSHENMPKKNTTANKISNFWFHFQTLTHLPDTQSGFRYYPLSCFKKIIWFTDRYNFELEVMVRNIWRGYSIIPIPITVYYPPEDVRITHFKPTLDFLRITVLNTFLSIAAILYYYPIKLIRTILK